MKCQYNTLFSFGRGEKRGRFCHSRCSARARGAQRANRCGRVLEFQSNSGECKWNAVVTRNRTNAGPTYEERLASLESERMMGRRRGGAQFRRRLQRRRHRRRRHVEERRRRRQAGRFEIQFPAAIAVPLERHDGANDDEQAGSLSVPSSRGSGPKFHKNIVKTIPANQRNTQLVLVHVVEMIKSFSIDP